MTQTTKKVIGCKLLAADGGSITSQYRRVIYKRGKWVEVPGDGAYVAITGGVNRGGYGPVLAWFECQEPTYIGDAAVQCFRRVKWIDCPTSWGGWLDMGGLTSAEGLTLPQSVGGWLYLGGHFQKLPTAKKGGRK